MDKYKEIIEDLYEAYVYAYPLVALEIHKRVLTNTVKADNLKAPVNQYIHSAGIKKEDTKYIIMPNLDTVYSHAIIDLKNGPIYTYKPKSNRYLTVLISDAYGNVVNIIGTGATSGNEEAKVVLTGPDYKGNISSDFIQIQVPTNLAYILTRVWVENDNDIKNIEKIQNELDIRPFSEYGKKYTYPNGKYNSEYDYSALEKLRTLDVEDFFNIFNELIGDNYGNNPETKLLNKIKKYGVGNKLTFELNCFDKAVSDKIKEFPKRIQNDFEELARNGHVSVYKDGWSSCKEHVARYGDDYLYRANVVSNGLGMNPVTMAIYPSATRDSNNIQLNGKNDYIFHFESAPPVNAFWSLALYDWDTKLQIDNDIQKYGVNDRSPLVINEDGSFDIYIQRKRPSEDKIANWIPSGDANLLVVLRLYLPKDEILNHTWKLPRIINAGEEKANV